PSPYRVGDSGANFRQVLECAGPAALWISQAGSWSQCMRKSERGLSMNRTNSEYASHRKRRRTAALQDATALATVARTSARFWSAPALRRFGLPRQVHGPNACEEAKGGSPRKPPIRTDHPIGNKHAQLTPQAFVLPRASELDMSIEPRKLT